MLSSQPGISGCQRVGQAGQHRGGDHHALFCMRQSEVLGDADTERTENDPDHEGEVELEEGRQQRVRVAGLQE